MPPRDRPPPRRATVVARSWLTPSMVRLVLGGPGLHDFPVNGFADQYVKLVFDRPDADRPAMRTYTVRAWDEAAHELTLDVVVHGSGLAGPWVRDARPGDEVLVAGPGGGYLPDPAADWQLLVADESALPAVAVILEALPADAVARVLVEVDGPADEVPLVAPAHAQVVWVHRDGAPRGERLVAAVTGLDFPAGTPQVFLHGEAGAVRTLRRHLLLDRGVPRERAASVSGYWRLGRDDETWRAEKPVWKREVEADVPAT
ncbi:siderophore-interacting protein [Cellulomonas citrea]|uniref:siderophore-interacting protein n=1 Tax=Cellulomonas citrea TaxID=1909423 RepID=UPI00135AAD7A|nr:siderophore-interacting protein [Cellulomonas citrea]